MNNQRKYQHYHKIDVTSKEMLPSGLRQMIEQAKFTYSASGKEFEK